MSQRRLPELLDQRDPMWPLIQEWINASPYLVETLPVERDHAEAALLTLQVTTRSPLGAMAYETGGIFVQHRWLHLLGSGASNMRDSLLSWNATGTDPIADPLADAILVAHDAIGGFFAVNLGAFMGSLRYVFYFAPDTLAWEDLGMSYADFIQWSLQGDLNTFYADVRWLGWEQECATLTGDQGFSFWPMLWSGGSSLIDRSRKVVPMRELWSLQRDLARQIADLPPGSAIKFKVSAD